MTQTQSLVGKIIDNYQITGVLGEGGMGVVYKARNLQLDKDVALKMMDPTLARDESFLKRFKSEAKSLARLQNPHIVSAYDFREAEEGICIIMEFVEGCTLADKIRESGPLPLELTLLIFKQILSALDHAHKAGVIHRDIKPSNILITPQNVVKVTDFGLAKIQQASGVTVTQTTGGTLYYMSPEQVRGLANVDYRGDIYSLGMTLYETLTGSLPFNKGDTQFAIQQTIVEGKIPSPGGTDRAVPKDFAKIVMKAIDKEPSRRFQSAGEMWEAMEKLERIEKPPERPRPSPGFRPTRTLIIGSLVALIAVGLFAVFRLYLAPAQATLSITTMPSGSVVSIDGKVIGRSPVKGYTVNPGTLAIRVSNPEYDTRDTSIVVTNDQELVLSILLSKSSRVLASGEVREGEIREANPRVSDRGPGRESGMQATLILRAVPRGSISVDGNTMSSTTDKPTKVDVSAGERIVEFTHPGYGSKKLTVRAKPGETSSVTCYFESSVNIVSKPVWSTILIDGKNTGMETPRALTLGPGRHKVTVRRAGYETIEGTKEVVIEPATEMKVIPIIFTLRKK